LVFITQNEKCLQRGTDWVFKYSGLHFVFKGLNTETFLLFPFAVRIAGRTVK